MAQELEKLPPTITVEKAGELLGISRGTAYAAARNGTIPTIRIARRLIVPTARLLALIGADAREGGGNV